MPGKQQIDFTPGGLPLFDRLGIPGANPGIEIWDAHQQISGLPLFVGGIFVERATGEILGQDDIQRPLSPFPASIDQSALGIPEVNAGYRFEYLDLFPEMAFKGVSIVGIQIP